MTDRNGSRHRVPHGSVRVQGYPQRAPSLNRRDQAALAAVSAATTMAERVVA
jgi:hypothetical protein